MLGTLISNSKFLVRSFWDGRVWQVTRQGSLFSDELHLMVLYCWQSGKMNPVAYLGSDLHVSQGLEIKTGILVETTLNLSWIPEKDGWLFGPQD